MKALSLAYLAFYSFTLALFHSRILTPHAFIHTLTASPIGSSPKSSILELWAELGDLRC